MKTQETSQGTQTAGPRSVTGGGVGAVLKCYAIISVRCKSGNRNEGWRVQDLCAKSHSLIQGPWCFHSPSLRVKKAPLLGLISVITDQYTTTVDNSGRMSMQGGGARREEDRGGKLPSHCTCNSNCKPKTETCGERGWEENCYQEANKSKASFQRSWTRYDDL